MTLFMIISKWREILIGLLAFLLLICLALLNHKTGQIDKFKQTEIVLQAQNAKAQAASALKEKQWSEQRLEAEQNYNAKIKQIESDSRLANASADSLSKQLKVASSRLSSATKETIVEYTIANNDILQDCMFKYRTVAEKADGHAADAERLRDAWPSE